MKNQQEPGSEPYPTTQKPPWIEEARPPEAAAFDELLRGEAIDEDAQRGIPEELAGVWFAILRGELALVDSFYTPERWYAALAPSAASRPVEPACRRLLARLLLGESQKQTGLECGLGAATLSSTLRRTLSGIGVLVQPCKAPPLLALMARAGVGAETVRARFSTLRRATIDYRIVSVARPEVRFASRLSRAQYAVFCRLVEGATHAEIALDRKRSERTVANQIAAVFRRLSISGRGELVARVVAEASSRSFGDDALRVAPADARYGMSCSTAVSR
jgi:DNA-binding CsgD family transcriptional regulator